MATLRYERAPNNLGDGLKRYIEDQIPMGGFMMSVLSNDLKEAFGRADIYNRAVMFEIVSWLWNEAPANCWGSPENVQAWLARRNVEP